MPPRSTKSNSVKDLRKELDTVITKWPEPEMRTEDVRLSIKKLEGSIDLVEDNKAKSKEYVPPALTEPALTEPDPTAATSNGGLPVVSSMERGPVDESRGMVVSSR